MKEEIVVAHLTIHVEKERVTAIGKSNFQFNISPLDGNYQQDSRDFGPKVSKILQEKD